MNHKIITFLSILLSCMILLVSCISNFPYSIPETTGSDSLYATSETTYPPATLPNSSTKEQDPLTPIDSVSNPAASYDLAHGCVDTEEICVFNYSGEMQFYDKKMQTFHRFCYDPTCDHQNWQQCISLRFVMDGVMGLQMIQYSEYDDRFYYLRGEQLCSFATDGSDFKIEYSFGNEGDLNRYAYSMFSVIYLQFSGKYAYMIQQENVPDRLLWRYNLETDEMVQITHPSGKTISVCRVMGDDIYIQADERIYQTDNTFADFADITDTIQESEFLLYAIYRNGVCYYFRYDENAFYQYDGKTKEATRLYQHDGIGHVSYMAITDSYIYYRVYYKTHELLMYDVYDTDIVRLDLRNGEIKMAFRFQDHISQYFERIHIFDIHFLTENKVLVYAQCYDTYGGSNARAHIEGFLLEVDENGVFYNMSFVEVSDLIFTEFSA